MSANLARFMQALALHACQTIDTRDMSDEDFELWWHLIEKGWKIQ